MIELMLWHARTRSVAKTGASMATVVTRSEAACICLDAAVRADMEGNAMQRWLCGETRTPSGGYPGALCARERMARRLGGTCMTRDS
jgi:hypothetical protein